MPKGYIIYVEDIKDEAAMGEYAGKAMVSLLQGGGTVAALDDNPDVREGEWYGNRTVILEFASVDAARAWYESADYQAAIPLRQGAADGNVVIVSGFEMPGA